MYCFLENIPLKLVLKHKKENPYFGGGGGMVINFVLQPQAHTPSKLLKNFIGTILTKLLSLVKIIPTKILNRLDNLTSSRYMEIILKNILRFSKKLILCM